MHDVWVVDAFTTHPFKGNGCGVIFNADDLSTHDMQAIARELNQAESIFFLKPTHPEANYHIRIFTPHAELPFAGHPTIAAAHSYLEVLSKKKKPDHLTQQCKAGLIPITLSELNHRPLFTMRQKSPEISEVMPAPELQANTFGVQYSPKLFPQTPLRISTGLPWYVFEVAPEIISHSIHMGAAWKLADFWEGIGFAFYAKTDKGLKVRAFSPPEDPVTGSANGCIAAAQWYRGDFGEQDTVTYTAFQGLELNREGTVFVTIKQMQSHTPNIYIAGQAVTTFTGQLLT